MLKFFLNLHSLLTPLCIFPIAYYLWFHTYHDHRLTWITMSFPIIYAYFVPLMGIKVLKLWEFRSKYSHKGFRPQSGFIYGSFASLFMWVARLEPSLNFNYWDFFRQAFILGSLIGFWNWLFEIAAIKKGIILFYGKSFLKKLEPATVALEYAPIGFGLNGFCLGILIYLNYFIQESLFSLHFFWIYPLELLLYLSIPIAGYSLIQYWIHQDYGFKSHKPT